MKKTAYLSIAAIVLCLLLASTWAGGEDQDNKPAPSSPLQGRVAVISLKSDPEAGSTLRDPVIKRLGEHEFLVGVAVDIGHPGDWQKGHAVWVAIDDISEIVEFANSDEAKKAGQEQLK